VACFANCIKVACFANCISFRYVLQIAKLQVCIVRALR